jgi:hydroxyacylglutathione hydrolase
MALSELSCVELKQKLENSEEFYLFDVRKPEEFESGHIDSAILIPFTELGEHLDDFDKEAEYVVNCGMGGVSAEAVILMKSEGFKNVKSVAGGYHQWTIDVGHYLRQ